MVAKGIKQTTKILSTGDEIFDFCPLERLNCWCWDDAGGYKIESLTGVERHWCVEKEAPSFEGVSCEARVLVYCFISLKECDAPVFELLLRWRRMYLRSKGLRSGVIESLSRGRRVFWTMKIDTGSIDELKGCSCIFWIVVETTTSVFNNEDWC